MASVTVREIKREEYEEWDQLVRISPQATIFNTSNWLTTCAHLLGTKLKLYGCFENDQIVAGCSFHFKRKALLNVAVPNLGITPYGGVIFAKPQINEIRKQEQSHEDIMQSLMISLENSHCGYLQLYNSPDLHGIGTFVSNGWKETVFYAYYLDITNFEEKISKKLRWTVNKAKKNGVKIEKSNDVGIFYQLLENTFRRQGLKPFFSTYFYEKMIDLLENSNKGELWIAKSRLGEACAAEIIVYDEKRAYRWAAASHDKLRKTGAPSLLLYEVLRDLKKRGFEEIDLMAGPPRVNSFLKQFKPRLVPFYCLEHKGFLTKIAGDIAGILVTSLPKKIKTDLSVLA